MAVAVRSKQWSIYVWILTFLWLGLADLVLTGVLEDFGRPVLLSAAVCLAFVLTVYLQQRWKIRTDPLLLPLTAMLSICGLLMVLRLSPEFAEKQFIWLFTGLAGYLLVIKGLPDYKKLEDFKYTYIFAALALLLTTVLFGAETGGAKSWLNFGWFKFQTSEPVKIIMVVFMASYLEEKKEVLTAGTHNYLGVPLPSLQYIGPLLAMWGLSLVLLIFQNDLGTALIFFGTFLAMIFIATGRWSYVAMGMTLFTLGAGLCYILYRHVQVRVDVWLNPWRTIDANGYQIVQSLFAIGSGGFYGTGLGLGQPNLIPAVHTDFIYSAWSEEMGLAGAVALLLIYSFLIYRGFRIALRARTGFGSLLAAGLTSLLAIQTIVIIAGVIKLLPLTGVTLPFVSYGGSSLVTSYLLLGLLTNISAKDGA